MVITRIAFTQTRDDDGSPTMAGGNVDYQDLERSKNPIEELAEGHFGSSFRPGMGIPSGWRHVDDVTLLRFMNFYGTLDVAEAIYKECLRYAAEDHIRLARWLNDDWEFLMITTTVYGKNDPDNEDEDEQEITRFTLGGVESDSDDFAIAHNKRYGLTRDSVLITKPTHTDYMEPYTLTVALENAGECLNELAKRSDVDTSNWQRRLDEAVERGVEEFYE